MIFGEKYKPIEVQLLDKKNEVIKLKSNVLSAMLMKKINKVGKENKENDNIEILCLQMALIFGGEANYYKNNFDIRTLTDVIIYFNKMMQRKDE